MADYFLVLDRAAFETRVRPALADAWRQRSFSHCHSLCTSLVAAARTYAERYHTGGDAPILFQVIEGLPFDRAFWRTLVGEILLFTAVEIPEIKADVDTLGFLTAPGCYRLDADRSEFSLVQQACLGSQDLTFGPAVYRPLHAGYNNAADVARLADSLGQVQPETWSAADLAPLTELDEEDRADELAYARDWFPALVELYHRARAEERVIVCESIY
jgi:hypothetical protein